MSFLFLVLAAKKTVFVRAYGCTCKQRNTCTVDKKTTVRSAAWRNILHSPERYIPVLTAIRVAVALKIFCQCHIEDSLVQAHTLQRIVHPHALQAGGPFFVAAAAFFFFGQHGLSFIIAIGTQQSHLHQRRYPTRDSSGSASALAEISSQASPRSLSDHLRFHRRPGLTASLSSNSCSKRQGCVHLSPLESLEAIHPIQTFSGRLRRRASLSSCLCERLGRNLRFRSLGLTASQVIARSKIGRDVGRCHGEQEGRIDVGFFANFIVGKDKSMVKFSFWGTCPLSPGRCFAVQ